MLDAIARSDGSRASLTRNLLRTRNSDGILGSFWITRTGDTTLNAVAVYRITSVRNVRFVQLGADSGAYPGRENMAICGELRVLPGPLGL